MDFDKKKIQSILRYSIIYFFIIKHLSLYLTCGATNGVHWSKNKRGYINSN